MFISYRIQTLATEILEVILYVKRHNCQKNKTNTLLNVSSCFVCCKSKLLTEKQINTKNEQGIPHAIDVKFERQNETIQLEYYKIK